jgi:SAM-dependent methyltransferase
VALDVSLVDEYARQRAWRPWSEIFAALPATSGQTVLDLGCAVGDQAAELAARGAHVIGLDANEELLGAARARGIPGTEFRFADLRSVSDFGIVADGIWSSFAAAFFPDLAPRLIEWSKALRPGGWIALTEIDDLFGHEPLAAESRNLFDGYAEEALAAGRYDFHMGRKLRGYLERAGFRVVNERMLEDQELAFAGAALPEVVEAWRRRLERMPLLRARGGEGWPAIEADLLRCLGDPAHRSQARVCFCLARKENE